MKADLVVLTGAGFSKAVAGLPTAVEILPAVEKKFGQDPDQAWI